MDKGKTAFGSYQWISADLDRLGGKPTIKGTRLSVSFVLECLAEGMTPQEIAKDYPGFSPEAVEEVLRFASRQTDKPVKMTGSHVAAGS